MKITGIPSPRAASRSYRSRPLVPGIRTSKTRQPGPLGAKASRNSAAEAYTSARIPTVVISQRSESRMSGSSSTMYAVGSCIGLVKIGRGERESEGRADAGHRLDADPPEVGLDDRPADRQPHAHPFITRAEIGVENPGEPVRRDPLAVVADEHGDGALGGRLGLHNDGRLRGLRGRQRIEGVADQVHQHLLD